MTCPTSTTAIPSPLANSINRTVDSRTWPTLPAAPSSSSIVAVWIESTTSIAGRIERATSTIRPDVALGEDLDGRAGRGVEQPEPLGPEADLRRRFLAGGVQDGPADAGGGLEQQRGLADTGLAAEQDQRAGDDPPAQHPIELADRRRETRDSGLTDVAQRDRLGDAEPGSHR